jgi:DNA-binding Lrp family transcriptional regulator
MLMTGAFVFVQSKLGRAYDVAKLIGKINGVKWACAVTGVYDVIACLEMPDMNSLSNLVIKKIQPIEGIERTHTAVIVSGEAGSIGIRTDFADR